MQFSRLISSKAFLFGAAYLAVVSLVAVVVMDLARPEWLVIAVFLFGSLLFLLLLVELRLRLSRLGSSISDLRRLEREARDALRGCVQGLEQLHQLSAAGERELRQALELLNVDLRSRDEAREKAFDAQVGALRSEYVERSMQIERRGRTTNEQLRLVGQDVKQLQSAIEAVERTFDPSHAGSLGGDVHRTLRLARTIERSLNALGDTVATVSRRGDHSSHEMVEFRSELLAQKKLLQELLASNDFS